MEEGDKQVTNEEKEKKLVAYMKNYGLLNTNKTELAKKIGWSRKTLYKRIHKNLKRLSGESLNTIWMELDIASKQAINEARKILFTSTDDMVKLRAILVISEIIEKYTKLMESFGKKPKIPDQLELRQMNMNINKEIREYQAIFNKLTPQENEKIKIILAKSLEVKNGIEQDNFG